MDFSDQMVLFTIFNVAIYLLAALIACLLLYLIIRQGVFHGMRAHTRWIDKGKR